MHRPSRRGVALLITLAAVTLLSALIVAYLSKSILQRQLAFSSAGQARAEAAAETAVQTILSDLRREISAGSNPSTVSGVTLYLPKDRQTMPPSRVLPPGLASLAETSIVKTSISSQPFWTGPLYGSATMAPIRSLPGNSTSSASRNGRLISNARWNRHYLLGTSLPTGWQSPDWILITRGGVVDSNSPSGYPGLAALKNENSSNPLYALGRYAYAIYDQGGLLDINLAGYPASLDGNATFSARRGHPGQVDLTLIPGITKSGAEQLVALRNAASGSSAARYSNYLFHNDPDYDPAFPTFNLANPGFLRVFTGDQAFISRQDLIRYQQSNSANFGTQALQYLTTFSREKNAPVFTPASSRPLVQAASAPANYPNYVGNPGTIGLDDEFNPDLTGIRTPGGAPRFSKRFPLSRLAMLTPNGPAPGASATDIKKYFGLEWDATGEFWLYTSPDGSSPVNVINRLKDISTERDPDFFETLQASIHIGSLGRHSGPLQGWGHFEPGVSSNGIAESQNIYYQIMQIGANIIDQADADNYPTEIRFGSPAVERIFGIEDLPYLLRIYGVATSAGSEVTGGLRFDVWNPHRGGASAASGPTEFRIAGASGTMRVVAQGTGFVVGPDVPVSTLSLPFIGGAELREPHLVPGVMNLGTVTSPGVYYTRIAEGSAVYASFWLQYKNPSGNWREYHRFRRLGSQMKESFAGNYVFPDGYTANYPPYYHMRSDPRTDRFGTSMNYLPGDGNFGPSAAPGLNLWPAANDPKSLSENHPVQGTIFFYQGTVGPGANARVGTISDNLPNRNAWYKDCDGEVRPGDGAFSTALGNEGRPQILGNSNSRPMILNRPFRSVGELGYVFRDAPFKSLDLSGPPSNHSYHNADAALLEAFCIDDNEVVAGRVNINTRHSRVLAALIDGASRNEDASLRISSSEATSLANALVAFTSSTGTGQGPITNRSELITRAASALSVGGSSAPVIKERREAPIRALAEMTSVRTWNLMVDVIAQAGRYADNAASLNDFIVEGERRYWLHLAIDRYTGEVVEQHLEPVYE